MNSKFLADFYMQLNPDNTMTFNRLLAHSVGATETIILYTLISKYYYYERNSMLDEEGWFYVTIPDLHESSSFGEKIQRNAIKHLENLGFIQTALKGVPAKRYFKINNDLNLLQEYLEKGEEIANNIKNAENEREKSSILVKPKFLNEEEKLTGAEKGTLMHLILQKLEIRKKGYTMNEISELIQKLYENNIITEIERNGINRNKILKFVQSNIYRDLIEAKEINREKPFYINIPAKEIFNKELEENVLVQGIIDLYYIDKNDKLVLVDYKTDYIEEGKEKELIVKYKKQLELYKRELESALNRKVDKIFIYSVYLGKELDF